MEAHTDRMQEIQDLSREVMEKQEQLNSLMRSELGHAVGAYEFDGAAGKVQLSDLFGTQRDLIVIHNMGKACAYCTLWADGLNGVLGHLENRSAFVLVSPDSVQDQKAFATARGWRMKMLSDSGKFTQDMGFGGELDGKKFVAPGFSTFRREADGSIERVAMAPFGPGDTYAPIWQMIALLKGGAEDWAPKFSY